MQLHLKYLVFFEMNWLAKRAKLLVTSLTAPVTTRNLLQTSDHASSRNRQLET